MGILQDTKPWDETTYGNSVRTLRVLVECEKGSIHKYEFDDKMNSMVIVRDLHKRYPYPFSYGCVPQTLAEDGDNLDAIILSDETIQSGTVVNCLPLGVVKMIDNGEEDDKLICTAFYTPHGKINLKKVIKYLQNYKYPHQSNTKVLGFFDVKEAYDAISKAHQVFLTISKGDNL